MFQKFEKSVLKSAQKFKMFFCFWETFIITADKIALQSFDFSEFSQLIVIFIITINYKIN